MQRDREATKARILDAAERVLTRSGFAGLGVNAIAAEAEVDKVLIYRYFGGLPQLLGALASRESLWPPAGALGAPPAAAAHHSAGERVLSALRSLARELRTRPLAREALAWELTERNELTDALAAAREEESRASLERLGADHRLPPYVDVPALLALLSAAITYLALIARTSDSYLGVDLQSEAGWRRVDKTLAAVVRTLLEPAEI